MAKKNVERIIASVFILVGFVFMLAPDFLTATGNSIASNADAPLNIVFILALLLTILGGILFFRSFKR
jgi:hypothetical protein